MTDPQPHAAIPLAHVLVDRPQPVMARVTPARLDPDLARREVQLVVQHHDIGRIELQVPHRLAHRLAAGVHEGLRLQGHDLLAPEPPFRGQPLEPRPPGREAVVGRDPINGHPADVVAVARVLRARVAQSDDQLHRPTFPCNSTHTLQVASRVTKTLSTFRP